MASILPSLNREDRALVACYRYIYAPRTGGAYDSHHRTTGIAGRTRRRGGCVAARGGRAAGRARAAHRRADGLAGERSGGPVRARIVRAGAAEIGLVGGP